MSRENIALTDDMQTLAYSKYKENFLAYRSIEYAKDAEMMQHFADVEKDGKITVGEYKQTGKKMEGFVVALNQKVIEVEKANIKHEADKVRANLNSPS